MTIKQLFAAGACTAMVLLTAVPAQAMGVVDATAAHAGAVAAAPASQQATVTAVAATSTSAEAAADSIRWQDGELALVAIAAMALAARGIALRMR